MPTVKPHTRSCAETPQFGRQIHEQLAAEYRYVAHRRRPRRAWSGTCCDADSVRRGRRRRPARRRSARAGTGRPPEQLLHERDRPALVDAGPAPAMQQVVAERRRGHAQALLHVGHFRAATRNASCARTGHRARGGGEREHACPTPPAARPGSRQPPGAQDTMRCSLDLAADGRSRAQHAAGSRSIRCLDRPAPR